MRVKHLHPDNSMRICFIIEYYYPHVGGAEILFQHLAEGLAHEGHDCIVLTCGLPGTPKFEVRNGVKIHRVAVPRWGDRYWFSLLAFLPGWRLSKEADIIHTMVYNGAVPAKVISLLRRKPLFIHVYEVIRKNWFSIGINPLSALLYRIIEYAILTIPYDAYSCISKNTMRELYMWGIPAEKLFLAYPGIDYGLFNISRQGRNQTQVRRRLGVEEDRFLYTFYGRPGYVKGVEYLVRAVPRVKKEIPPSTLLLILSRKPEAGRNRVMKMVEELRLDRGKDIIVLDSVPRQELPSFIAASDCIVVPSLSEGFGFTCVEACAMGRPVVATTAGSLPEVIFGRYVLVPPGNAEALAKGIIRVWKKEYEHSVEKRFPWNDHVKKHVDAYRNLLEERAKK